MKEQSFSKILDSLLKERDSESFPVIDPLKHKITYPINILDDAIEKRELLNLVDPVFLEFFSFERDLNRYFGVRKDRNQVFVMSNGILFTYPNEAGLGWERTGYHKTENGYFLYQEHVFDDGGVSFVISKLPIRENGLQIQGEYASLNQDYHSLCIAAVREKQMSRLYDEICGSELIFPFQELNTRIQISRQLEAHREEYLAMTPILGRRLEELNALLTSSFKKKG